MPTNASAWWARRWWEMASRLQLGHSDWCWKAGAERQPVRRTLGLRAGRITWPTAPTISLSPLDLTSEIEEQNMQIVIHAPNRLLPPSLKRTAMLQLIVFLAVLTCATSDAVAGFIYTFGFESGSPSLGPVPTQFGHWWGDRVAYRTAEQGITPEEGNRMLRCGR